MSGVVAICPPIASRNQPTHVEMLIQEFMGASAPASDSELDIELGVPSPPLKRWTPDLATGFQSREQEIEIQHPALRSERVQNSLGIERS
jgi:hypothetical protein